VAGSKSKKAKGVYQMMRNQLSITTAAENYKQGVQTVGQAIAQSSWSKGQIVLTKEKNTDMLGGDDEEDFDDDVDQTQGTAIGIQMINKTSIMEEVTDTVQASIETKDDGASISLPTVTAAAAGVAVQEKTIQDILEEREDQLKELEQLQDMKQSAFVDALAHDIANTVGASGSGEVTYVSSYSTSHETNEEVKIIEGSTEEVQINPSKKAKAGDAVGDGDDGDDVKGSAQS
jgi:hypothetical protein